MRYILVLMLLSGCSTSIFTDKNSKESASIENRDVKNKSTDLNQNPNIRVNKLEDPKIETVKIVSDRKDPNKLFDSYSVYFDLDEYTIKEQYKPIMKKHGEFLAKNPNEFVFAEGHTDERGGAEYNLSLGQKRSNAIRVELLRYGARENQIEAYSYGSEKPKALGSNEEAWSQNRRVDLQYRN